MTAWLGVPAFHANKGIMRMAAAIRAGIHRDTLRRMVEQGDLQRPSRGLYQLAEAAPP